MANYFRIVSQRKSNVMQDEMQTPSTEETTSAETPETSEATAEEATAEEAAN